PQEPQPQEPQPQPQEPQPQEPAEGSDEPATDEAGDAAAEAPRSWTEAFRWRPLGPTAFGGRIVDIEVDPVDSTIVYAAAGSGGLWRSANRGTTWECVFRNEGTVSIGDVAIAPSNGNVIYVGTGEANNQRSSYWGDGVYRSDDAGKTWKHLGLVDSHHIARIVVSPTDENRLYVAAMGHLYTENEERGVYRSLDGGATWERTLYVGPSVGATDLLIDPRDPNVVYAATYERIRRPWNFDGAGPGSGIWKSTDAGATWTRLAGGLPGGEIGRIGLAMFAGDPNFLYAAVPNANLITDRASVGPPKKNEDGTWSLPFGLSVRFADGVATIAAIERNGAAARAEVPRDRKLIAIGETAIVDETSLAEALGRLRPGDRFRLRVARDDGERGFDIALPPVVTRETGGEFYRSNDGGSTWSKVNTQPVGGDPDYYYGQVRVDPKDPERIYVLSVPVMVSSDGGKTWSNDGAPSVHVDHHALWIDPADPRHLLLGNDGGYHESWDRGATWTHFDNLPIAQFYAIAVDMQVPYHVYGGTQDNGSWGGPSRSRNPGGIVPTDWYRIGGGDGFYVQVDPRNADLVIGESQFGALYRRHKPTGESRGIRPPQSDADALPDRYNWNSPLVMSRHDNRTLYYGGNRLFRSRNLGDDWEAISPDLSSRDLVRISGNVPHGTLTTIAESPFDRDELLVGTDDGRLHWTRDGGATWTDVGAKLPFAPQGWWASRVVLSQHDRRTAYATFTGYREDDFRPFVFRTKDGGETWESIASDLPQEPINVIVEHPRNAAVLLVGTEFGVQVTTDGGAHWTRFGAGMPRLAVHDLVIHPRELDLVAGTHAQGFWIVDDLGSLGAANFATEGATALFPVRDEILWQPVSQDERSGNRGWSAPNPMTGARIAYRLESEVGARDISLEVVNDKGETVARLEAPRQAGFHRVDWNFRGQRGPGGRGRGRRGAGGPGAASGSPTAPVVPGVYEVILKVGDQEYRTRAEVLEDPIRATLQGPAR
ncbi:MAG TPA: hypothetical protein DCQ98_00525, partial [Planctomycetaceae bacterium]|nr:hypothetical protein [Planctomycetaceae bacterium]